MYGQFRRNDPAQFVHFQKCSQLVSSTFPALCAYGYLCKGLFSALERVIRLVPSIKHVLQTKNCKIRFHHFGPSVFFKHATFYF